MSRYIERKQAAVEARQTAEALILTGPDGPAKSFLLERIAKRTGVKPVIDTPSTTQAPQDMSKHILEAAQKVEPPPLPASGQIVPPARSGATVGQGRGKSDVPGNIGEIKPLPPAPGEQEPTRRDGKWVGRPFDLG